MNITLGQFMEKLWSLIFLLAFIWALPPTPAMAGDMVITYRSPESPSDRRYDYDNAVLRLALEKTREEWGGYTMVPSQVMNYSRAVNQMRFEELENPMFKLSANAEYCRDLSFAPFPVDLGVVGYRMFFVSTKTNKKLSQVRHLEELKDFLVGQGYGWLDVEILRAEGFSVATIPKYESLFSMVAEGRFDLFARGVNEVKMEYDAHKHIPDFELNRTVGIYYPLPRFFFTNKSSSKAAERVYEGLIMAYEDGSLLELWEREYGPGLEFGEVDKVKFFEIENPYVHDLDPGYEKYFKPLK